MGAAETETFRIKREECRRTKHDADSSKWKILVGASDWADYLLGKEGADRYRVHNLPGTSGPGVYELGIVVSRSRTDRIDSDDVVVVYLGQADSVRTRLQRYGRSGAHLNNNPSDGSGCFDDIFSRGHSIVYRWAPMKNKADALKTESELLNTFDYAWNKGSNGTRRHYDVLRKLNTIAADNIQFPKSIRKLLYFSQKPAGIKIKASKLPSEQNNSGTYADGEGHSFFSQIFKFTKSHPRLVLERHGADEEHTGICGVSLDDGSVCRTPPVKGRKRCTQHKGLRIRRSNPVKPPVTEEKCTVSEEHKWRSTNGSNSNLLRASEYVRDVDFDTNACSFYNCPELSRSGRVQPQVFSEKFTTKPHYDTICGVELGNGTFCNRQPVKGRVRCEEHKGMKIKGIKSKSAEEHKSNVYDVGSNLSALNEKDFCSSVCGAQMLNGSYCRRPVKGNTNCSQHSKQVLNNGSTSSPCNDWSSSGTSICGAPTRNGSYCKRTVKGGGTCWQH